MQNILEFENKGGFDVAEQYILALHEVELHRYNSGQTKVAIRVLVELVLYIQGRVFSTDISVSKHYVVQESRCKYATLYLMMNNQFCFMWSSGGIRTCHYHRSSRTSTEPKRNRPANIWRCIKLFGVVLLSSCYLEHVYTVIKNAKNNYLA